MNSILAPTKTDRTAEFVVCFFVLTLAAAMLAMGAPIAFSVATVFLFAGPHNWVEVRYFLSRMPARFGKFKQFFAWSFAGLGVLVISYIALVYFLHTQILSGVTSGTMLAVWNSLLILWVVRLVLITGSLKPGRDLGYVLPLGLVIMGLAWLSPAWFGMSLVYLHPLIGFWILDREIRRSRPAWRQPYLLCLLSIPLFLMAIWWNLHGTPSLSASDNLTVQITKHAGSLVMTGASTYMLVATHTFLEMVHYGVWLIAIPVVSAGWRNWQPCSLPITNRSPQWKRLVPGILVASSFAVVVLWVCFALNYSVTRDVYFTLAMAHVLAEVPFLLKTFS